MPATTDKATPTAPSTADLRQRAADLEAEQEEVLRTIESLRPELGDALLAQDAKATAAVKAKVAKAEARRDELAATVAAAERALVAAEEAEAKAARAAIVAELNGELDAADVALQTFLDMAEAIAQSAAAAKAHLLAAAQLHQRLRVSPVGITDRIARPAWPYRLAADAVQGGLGSVFGEQRSAESGRQAKAKLRVFCDRFRVVETP